MPTLVKSQLTETATPMLEIWDRMEKELLPNARLILAVLGYYAKRDLPVPDAETELTSEEKEEINPVVRALVEAVIESEMMRKGTLSATLKKVAKDPALFFSGQLPASVEWEIACHYQRGDEEPGTYCLDVWGGTQIDRYAAVTPAKNNIAKAAEAAFNGIEDLRTPGRPPSPANWIIAEQLSTIFRSSGQPIVRRLEPTMRHDKLVFVEDGPFCDFLNLVLGPLQLYLTEHRLPPVTIESVVRIATEDFS
jgi:hypothetical protein